MKKLFLFILCLWSLAAYAQVGSQSVSGIKFRVNDTTTYQAAAVSAHTAGYADIYWNNQATTKHFDAWNGSSYTHIFDFTGGSGIDGKPAMTSYASSHTMTLADYNSFNNQGITRWTISGPANLTVPLDATVDFNDGAQIGIDNQGSDTLTVVFTGGVTGNTGGYVEIFPGGSALLLKISTNLWDLLGTQPGGGGGSEVTPAALTKTDDTNVTLTLGGTPTTALLQATSITAGWTGDLAFSRLTQGSALSVLGVTGNATDDHASIAAASDHQVLRRSGTAISFGAVNLAQSAAVTGILPVANGGTNTATPAIVAGTNVTVSGTWPNQTINSSGAVPLFTFVSKTDDYTLSSTDLTNITSGQNLWFTMSKATALSMTVPPNSDVAFAIGTTIRVQRIGVGVLTFVQGSGVTITASGIVLNDPGLNAIMELTKTGTNTWDLQNGNVGVWYDWSPTFTGFSTPPSIVAARYIIEGKKCICWLRTGTGTSNAAGLTISLPAVAKSGASFQQTDFGTGVNNGSNVTTQCVIQTTPGSNVANCYTTPAGGAWITSGNKSFQFSSFTFEID